MKRKKTKDKGKETGREKKIRKRWWEKKYAVSETLFKVE